MKSLLSDVTARSAHSDVDKSNRSAWASISICSRNVIMSTELRLLLSTDKQCWASAVPQEIARKVR